MINDEQDVMLYLPFPPTVNDYYGTTNKKVRYVKAKGKEFKSQVAEAIQCQLPDVYFDEPICLTVILHVPDERTRDLDNYMKALQDAITEAGLWEDDSLIDQLSVYRGTKVKGGKTRIMISDAGPVLNESYWP